MPAKMARSAPRPSSGLPEMTIAVRTSRLPCKRPRKSRISKTVRESSGESRLMVPPPWLASAMIAALAVMSFAPIKFLHPLRVRHWRVLNIALLAAWAALAFLAVINDLAPGPYVTWPLVAIAIYFFGAGLLRRLA